MLKLQHNEHGTTCFIKGKRVSVWERENVKFLETKEKDVKMGWMNGTPWVDCHTLEARTVVVE